MTARRRARQRRLSAEAFFTVPPETRLAEEQWALRLVQHKRNAIELAAGALGKKAQSEFEAALKMCPTYAEAWFLLGVLRQEARVFEGAYECFAQAVILTPMFAEAQERLAAVAAILEWPDKILTPWIPDPKPAKVAAALAKFKCAVGVRGVVEFMPIDADEAILRAEILQRPSSADLAMKLGRLFVRQGRFVEAELFLRYALALKPWHEDAASWLCIFLGIASRRNDVKREAKKAIEAGASADNLFSTALWHSLMACDWADYKVHHARVMAALKTDPVLVEPFSALHYTDDPELQARCARDLGKTITVGCKPFIIQHRSAAPRVLKLGYVSAEFNDHAVASLIAELYELHDRARFKVYGYSLWRGAPSSTGRRMEKACDKFTELLGITHEAAARQILDDEVDILIDVTGYTTHCQPRIIAYRPAPVQVNYLGYPGTLATSAVDYAIVDKIVVSEEQRPHFTEALVYMPHSYQVNDRKKPAGTKTHARETYGLPKDGVVYCNFNEPRKILPQMFAAWMRVLHAVPGSVLWLLSADAVVIENLKREASQAGLDPERIVFGPRLVQEAHLARYAQADLFLDTLPYNAHTTASDALWVGCPVLTVPGRTFQSRVAASLLHAVGLPELIAGSLAAYEECAVRVGLDKDFRDGLASRLKQAKASCPLFDTPKYARHIEWAYEEMWRRYAAGASPSSFEVPALAT
ncbi:MAG: hypothetical protein K2P94_06870 [Rhodospirillaceae bacterium]|nr:hypothetical protein [Rhodospirillaceae bacterium]